MKYLILLLVIGVVALLLGFKRRTPPVSRGADEPRKALTMVSCAECGLHMPVAEALPGLGGHFCCADHRKAYETRHGGVQ